MFNKDETKYYIAVGSEVTLIKSKDELIEYNNLYPDDKLFEVGPEVKIITQIQVQHKTFRDSSSRSITTYDPTNPKS